MLLFSKNHNLKLVTKKTGGEYRTSQAVEKKDIPENTGENVLIAMNKIAEVIEASVKRIRKEKIQKNIKEMIKMIYGAYGAGIQIFVVGEGRSGLVGMAFAMRLVHLGFPAYIIGQPTTPGIRKGDIVVAFSGSGTTKTVKDNCETAIDEQIGARLITVTSKRKSILARLADLVIDLPGRQGIISEEDYLRRTLKNDFPRMPMKTVFEINAAIFCDSVISELMSLTQTTEDKMEERHATDRLKK